MSVVKNILKKLKSSQPEKQNQSQGIELCGTCLHPIQRGKKGHNCNETSLMENLCKLLPEKVQEKIAGKVLKRKLSDGDKENVQLATGRKSFKFQVDKNGDKQFKQFKTRDILRIKKRCNLLTK